MTLDEFDAMLGAQNGGCGICGAPISNGGRGTHVDHCHDSGAIRGLLCRLCNVGLGQFKDSPALLRAAAAYLEEHATS